MKFDIRLPIGLMFLLIGLMLAAYGLLTPAVEVHGANGHNINAWWGSFMALFGLVMLGLARRAQLRGRHAP